MPDEEITLFNDCTDLVSLRRNELFLLQLFGSKQPGEWISVREFCLQIGLAAGHQLKPELFTTWLSDPLGQPSYAVLLFYDDESKWSMAAHYNRGRLFSSASPHQEQVTEAALPASSCAGSQQRAPAADL